jgi:hypothetical protein
VVVSEFTVAPEALPVAPPTPAPEDVSVPEERDVEEEVSPPHPDKNTVDESNKQDMTTASNLPPFTWSSIYDVIIRPVFH